MKKFLNICLVFLLLFSTSGVAISSHYCGEILQKIGFSGVENPCCDAEGMPDDCCKEEVKIVKTDEHKLSQSNIELPFSPVILQVIDNFIILKNDNYSNQPLYHYYNIPPPTDKDIVVLVQSFLI